MARQEVNIFDDKNESKTTLLIVKILCSEAKQFCLNTALHGYKFIVLPKRTLLERILWIVIVLISLITSLTLLSIAWINFMDNPTLIVTDSTHHHIWNYPFPAVTICSYNKISKQQAYKISSNFTQTYGLTKEELMNEMKLLFQLIHTNNKFIPIRNFTRLQDILDANNLEVHTLMKRLAPKCKDMLQRCKWKGEEKRCESIFEQIKSTEGYCCSFNYFGSKNHKFSGAMADKAPKSPRRVSACGYQTGLEVLIDNKPHEYFATQISSIGHRIFIHNPFDYPDWTCPCLLNEIKLNNFINISPTLTYATEKIKDLSLRQRNCLFSNERSLHNFAVYTYHNCIIECRMNLTKKYCGCIPFYYYEEGGTYLKSRICNLRDIKCLMENKRFILSSIPGYGADDLKTNEWENESGPCDCLPDCEYVEYLAEASSDAIKLQNDSLIEHFYSGGINIANQSVARLFFNDLVAKRNRRDVTYSWHTLLAYYGGILGLFVGFSFVSGFEMIYFFTFKLVTDVIRKRNKKKVKPKKLFTRNSLKIFPMATIQENVSSISLPTFYGNRKLNREFLN